jgi:hypothetical protein
VLGLETQAERRDMLLRVASLGCCLHAPSVLDALVGRPVRCNRSALHYEDEGV